MPNCSFQNQYSFNQTQPMFKSDTSPHDEPNYDPRTNVFFHMIPDARECSEKQKSFFRRAMAVAQNSQCMNHRHGAIIVKGKDILSEGSNHKSWHLYHKFSVHAEVDALCKLPHNKKLLSQCDMYVVRIGNESMGFPLKYSKPCPGCTKAILKSGIRRVFYSTSHEFYESMGSLPSSSSSSSMTPSS